MPNLVEMNFPGPAVMITDREKMLTIRAGDKYSCLESGEEFIMRCGLPSEPKEDLPLTVLQNEKKRIEDNTLPPLLLDGFNGPKSAINVISRIYPDYKPGDSVNHITFMPTERFIALDSSVSQVLLDTDQETALRDPATREVFLPTLAIQISNPHLFDREADTYDWLEFCRIFGIASQEEVGNIAQNNARVMNLFSTEQSKFRNFLECEKYFPGAYDQIVLLK